MPARGPPYGPGCRNPPKARDTFAPTAAKRSIKTTRTYIVKAWAVDRREFADGGSSSIPTDACFALALDAYEAVRKLHKAARKLGGR